jgi:hypothetical protein
MTPGQLAEAGAQLLLLNALTTTGRRCVMRLWPANRQARR